MGLTNLLASLSVIAAAPALAQSDVAPAPAGPAGPAAPGGAADLNSRLINVPGTSWTVYGPDQIARRLEKEGPKGYPAIRVTVAKAGKNAWDAGAVSAVPKPVGAGDALLIAVYLRAPELKDGQTLSLPLIGATGAAAPYPPVAGEKVVLTNQWKLYFASGKAPKAFPADGVQATVHLAGSRQVIDLGPLRVYDFGPDFDLHRLPHN